MFTFRITKKTNKKMVRSEWRIQCQHRGKVSDQTRIKSVYYAAAPEKCCCRARYRRGCLHGTLATRARLPFVGLVRASKKADSSRHSRCTHHIRGGVYWMKRGRKLSYTEFHSLRHVYTEYLCTGTVVSSCRSRGDSRHYNDNEGPETNTSPHWTSTSTSTATATATAPVQRCSRLEQVQSRPPKEQKYVIAGVVS